MRYSINLLPKERHKNVGDRVFYFILNYLRYIIVITQLVVIFVFIAKFSTDQRIVDLQESIDQKYEIVSVFQPLVKEAKATEFRMKEVEKVLVQQERLSLMLRYVMNNFPSTLTLKQLQVTEEIFYLRGITADPDVLRLFVEKMKSDAQFESVSLKTIKKTDEGFEFDIELQKYHNS